MGAEVVKGARAGKCELTKSKLVKKVKNKIRVSYNAVVYSSLSISRLIKITL